jgi:MFS family permease
MWELYAFWAFVPIILKTYSHLHPAVNFNIPMLSFFIIGTGGLACVLAAYISELRGVKETAFGSLMMSGACCLLSPFIFSVKSEFIFLGFLIFWGMVVIADSPLFSTLVAKNALTEMKGTALTIVNCIGFSITILSIQLITSLEDSMNMKSIYLVLAIGPVLGLISLKKGSQSKKYLKI